jgi:POT family proton-dependent oligopeptide transporter
VQLWGGAALAAILVLAAGGYTGRLPISAMAVADWAGYLLLLVAVSLFAWLIFGGDWTPAERRRVYAIGFFFVASALFWSQFEQAGSTLNLFADRATRHVLFGWQFPTSYFQSLQPLFIIVFAPAFAWLWIRLGTHEPTAPAKFAFGLFCAGAGFGILAIASTFATVGVTVSPWWLVATYLLHTFGELSLSPVGLSAMTKLAPERVAGLIMGFWFLATSVGNLIGGRVAALYGSMPLPHLFGAVAAFGIGAGIVTLAVAPRISRMTRETP